MTSPDDIVTSLPGNSVVSSDIFSSLIVMKKGTANKPFPLFLAYTAIYYFCRYVKYCDSPAGCSAAGSNLPLTTSLLTPVPIRDSV